MGRKSKYTIEQKIEAVEDYKSGKRGTRKICNDLNMREITLCKWNVIYDDYGEDGFQPSLRNKRYSKELKECAVEDYLLGTQSYDDIARKYEIPSSTVLKTWVSKYNGYEKLKDYNPKGEVGLQDKRGKRKQDSELSDIEKLQCENSLLKYHLELQKRENSILKK